MASLISTYRKMGFTFDKARANWSWGVKQPGVTVLQVWQHHTKWIDGQSFIRVTYRTSGLELRDNGVWYRLSDNKPIPGMKERERHIADILSNPSSQVLGLMVEGHSRADDDYDHTSNVKKHNTTDVFALDPTNMMEIDGELYFPAVDRIKTQLVPRWLLTIGE